LAPPFPALPPPLPPPPLERDVGDSFEEGDGIDDTVRPQPAYCADRLAPAPGRLPVACFDNEPSAGLDGSIRDRSFISGVTSRPLVGNSSRPSGLLRLVDDRNDDDDSVLVADFVDLSDGCILAAALLSTLPRVDIDRLLAAADDDVATTTFDETTVFLLPTAGGRLSFVADSR
jgi:hypothetical protein